MDKSYRILYRDWYDERGEWEAESKGWLQGVTVELKDGSRYPLFFYDPIRLAQDWDGRPDQSSPYFAEPGLVVIPEIRREVISQTIELLVQKGYFNHFKPMRSLAA